MPHLGANAAGVKHLLAMGWVYGVQNGLAFPLVTMAALGALVWAVTWHTQR